MLLTFLSTILPQALFTIRSKHKHKKELVRWIKNGRVPPSPHLVKQSTIQEYKKEYSIKVLIETGTYLGDMVQAQKHSFKEVYSIELAEHLYKRAKKRFRTDTNVTIIQGDSGKVLPKLLSKIEEPAIFWLDGHYSSGLTAKGDKNCPIYQELDAILTNQMFNHILLIDDARCFIGENDYPTITELTSFIENKNPEYKVEVKNDIIRYTI